jgi:hypothetical protein
MERGHTFVAEVLEERVLEEVNMEMDNIELMCPATDIVQHCEVTRRMVMDAGESQALRRAGDELG